MKDLRGRSRAAVIVAVAFVGSTVASPAAQSATPPSSTTDCKPNGSAATVLTNPGTTVPWAQTSLGLTDSGVWTLTQGAGVIVGVVDSGVDHVSTVLPDSAVLPGSNMLVANGSTQDCVDHGTEVAALIAGRPGMFGFAGVAPRATIYPVVAADSSHSTDSASADAIARGIRDAADHGARVINVSMTTTPDTPALDAAVRYAHGKGALIVAAAGNQDTQQGCLFPAALDGVLSVGSVGQDGAISTFTEACAKAGVAAPGDNIAAPSAAYPGYLVTEKGTSMACAFVSGTAALILSYRPGLTPDQLIHRIEATADRPSTAYLPDPRVGWGTVNPYRAVTEELPGEQGDGAAAVAVSPTPKSMALPGAAVAKPDGLARGAVLAVVGAGFFALAAPAVLLTLRHGRRRSWRPGVSQHSGE